MNTDSQISRTRVREERMKTELQNHIYIYRVEEEQNKRSDAK